MLRLLLLLLAVLAAVIVIRTAAYRPEPVPDGPADPVVHLNEDRVLAHLAEAVTFRTVSRQPPTGIDEAEFERFLSWLETTYPEVFETLAVERLGGLTPLFTWQGSEAGLAGVLLAAHYDVVPVIAGTEGQWQQPPFAGRIADGYLWGRGALDNKNGVVGLMEAVTLLVREGFQPRRTVYLSFGHDEELGGENGAAAVVAHLEASGVRLAWSLDEGSFVYRDIFPGVEVPIATINTAEKGSATLRLAASAPGGHSSMPSRHTAVGRLARALVALEEHPMPGGLEGVAASTFEAAGPYMPLLPRAMLANRWLFDPVLEWQLSRMPYVDAMLRTTTAPTMLEASPKVNVLPVEASALVNFRIHPRDAVADVVAHVERHAAGEHVRVEMLDSNPPSAVSNADGPGFHLVEEAVRAEFGRMVVAPGLLVAATDSRHYGRIAEDAYRFNPMVVTQAELDGFHGTNERISTEGMIQGVRTYVRLLRRL